MSVGPAAAIGAFASAAPLAYLSATSAAAVCVALALGPGPRCTTAAAAIGAVALTLGAPEWGWRLGAVLASGLIAAAAGLRWRRPGVTFGEIPRAALLLGRTARLAGEGARLRVRLDGRGWRARLEGGGGCHDARVRIVRIERDGRLVVRRASG